MKEKRPIGLTATASLAALRRALKIVEPTVFEGREPTEPHPLRLQGQNGHLIITARHESWVTRVEVTDSTAESGEVWIEHRDLISGLRGAPADTPIALSHLAVRTYDPASKLHSLTHPFPVQPPHAASIDAGRLRNELSHLLRSKGDPYKSLRFYGVRFWLIKDAIVLQAGDLPGATVVRIPAAVERAAIGRTVMVWPDYLQAFVRGCAGACVEIGIGEEQRWVPFSLACGQTSLVASALMNEPLALPEFLFTDAADHVVLNRWRTLRALKQVEDRIEDRSYRGSVIVHLDTQPLRISHERDDAPNDGRVLVLDPARLRTALTSFDSREVSLHLRTLGPLSPITVTEPGVTLGDLHARHHVMQQNRDYRDSQPRPRPNARVTPSPAEVSAMLQPRTVDGLRRVLAAPRSVEKAPVPLALADRVLVRVQPTIGPEALDPRLWLMDDPAADWTVSGRPTTFAELATLVGWTVGEYDADETSTYFWLVRSDG